MKFELSKINETLDLTNSINKLTGLNLEEIGDSIYNLINLNRINKKTSSKVYELVKELKRFFPNISYEYLQYLIGTTVNSHRTVIQAIGTKELNKDTQTHMMKIKRILRENGVKNTVIKKRFTFSKYDKGSTHYFNKDKTFHFINI